MIGRKNDRRITTVRSTLKDVQKEKKHKSPATISERDKETSRILKVLMLIMPVIMICILVLGVWRAIDEYVTNNPLVQLDSDAPSALVNSKDADAEKKRLEELEYMFRIVNPEHPIDESYKVDVAEYKGVQINAKMKDGLEKLMKAASDEGFKPIIECGYISIEEQQKLYQDKVNELIKEKGYTMVRAESIAKEYVPVGGCSEFQTGLLIKLKDGQNKKSAFSTTKLYRWLINYGVNYGFVIRYPEYKQSFTDVPYEPTIFRYVGEEHSKKMHTYNMCLEEYYDYAKSAI